MLNLTAVNRRHAAPRPGGQLLYSLLQSMRGCSGPFCACYELAFAGALPASLPRVKVMVHTQSAPWQAHLLVCQKETCITDAEDSRCSSYLRSTLLTVPCSEGAAWHRHDDSVCMPDVAPMHITILVTVDNTTTGGGRCRTCVCITAGLFPCAGTCVSRKGYVDGPWLT